MGCPVAACFTCLYCRILRPIPVEFVRSRVFLCPLNDVWNVRARLLRSRNLVDFMLNKDPASRPRIQDVREINILVITSSLDPLLLSSLMSSNANHGRFWSNPSCNVIIKTSLCQRRRLRLYHIFNQYIDIVWSIYYLILHWWIFQGDLCWSKIKESNSEQKPSSIKQKKHTKEEKKKWSKHIECSCKYI